MYIKAKVLMLLLSSRMLRYVISENNRTVDAQSEHQLRGFIELMEVEGDYHSEGRPGEPYPKETAESLEPYTNEFCDHPNAINGRSYQSEHDLRELQYSGSRCSSNAQCQQYGGPLSFCNGFYCYNPYKCGKRCNTNNECRMAYDGCSFCNVNSRTCQRNQGGGYDDRTCINNFGMLQSALNTYNGKRVISLCRNADIVVSGNSGLTTNRSNLTVRCGGGSCIIRRTSGTGRLMTFSGGYITLNGLIFANGYGSMGGAIYIQGIGNRIINCSFRNNQSVNGNGGAGNIGGGTVSKARGYSNRSTNYCNGVYVRNSGRCFNTNTGYGNDRNIYNNNQNNQCGNQCFSHENCRTMSGPCTQCSQGGGGRSRQCYDPNGGGGDRFINQCGTPCSYHSDCQRKAGVCTWCDFRNKRCYYPNNRNVGGYYRTCISNQESLRNALQGNTSGVVQICSGSNIILSQEITTDVNNKVLQCQGSPKSCTISRQSNGGMYRLLKFTGNNVQVHGIVFKNGYALNGKGGAISSEGSNIRIVNCEFEGNRASQSGGAVSMRSGTIVDCKGAGNYAPQCTDAYNEVTGTCVNLS